MRGTGLGLSALIVQNWRTQPVQFEVPAKSQVMAELIRAAGFEGILYRSTKGPNDCLAVFPDKLRDGSFIELEHAPPPGVRHTRLDAESADALTGWDTVQRSR